jgi:hypothetical protein
MSGEGGNPLSLLIKSVVGMNGGFTKVLGAPMVYFLFFMNY